MSCFLVVRCILDEEPVYLNGNDIWIRKGLNADEALVLRAQNAAFEVAEVVEFSYLSRLIRIIQMADEPIRSVAQDILLNRTYFLGCIHKTEMILGPFFCCSYPDVLEIKL